MKIFEKHWIMDLSLFNIFDFNGILFDYNTEL